MSLVSFTSTYLANKNKKGILKPDENGYYDLIVGGLNIHNSAGHFYLLESSKDLFENSTFQRRIQNGALKGENGHPFKTPGMTDEQFLERFLYVDPKNVVCHFSKVWLDYDSVKDSSGRPVVAIMAKVKPSGEKGYVLKESLDDPNQNTAFSVRGFTKDFKVGNVINRILTTIITFDYVDEPGIAIATKWTNPTLESFHDTQLTKDVYDNVKSKLMKVGQAEEANLLLNELSWIDSDSIFNAEGYKPKYANWSKK